MLSSELEHMPVGAEVVAEGVRFRVWAPRRTRVAGDLRRHVPPVALARDGEYLAGTCPGGDGIPLLSSGSMRTTATTRIPRRASSPKVRTARRR